MATYYTLYCICINTIHSTHTSYNSENTPNVSLGTISRSFFSNDFYSQCMNMFADKTFRICSFVKKEEKDFLFFEDMAPQASRTCMLYCKYFSRQGRHREVSGQRDMYIYFKIKKNKKHTVNYSTPYKIAWTLNNRCVLYVYFSRHNTLTVCIEFQEESRVGKTMLSQDQSQCKKKSVK